MIDRFVQKLCACVSAAAVLAAPALADAPPALTTSGHLDLDAMRSNSTAAGSQSEDSVLGQWGGSFDTARAGWWRGGLFEFSVEGVRSGGSASAGTGAVQIPSNEWAPDFLRIYQATYKHDFGAADVRVGIMDINQYFESSDQAALLHNSSFGMMPTVMANFNGPSFPNPGLAAMADVHLDDAWTARAGIWQGEPPSLRGAFDRGSTTIAEVEHDWAPPGADTPDADIKVGVWHDRVPTPDGPTGSGAYVVGETRWHWRHRPWGAFVLGGNAPSQGEQDTRFAAAGLLVGAPLAGRPHDQASVGVSTIALATGHSETVVEALYSLQINDALALQPDLQRFWNPGGVASTAWAGGVRVHLAF